MDTEKHGFFFLGVEPRRTTKKHEEHEDKKFVKSVKFVDKNQKPLQNFYYFR